MTIALHLSPPPELAILVPFTDDLYGRLDADSALKFATLLRQFYVEADCETFFKQQRKLYKEASKRLDQLCQQVDIEWYERFFGQQFDGRFVVIAALGNGTSNYGFSITSADGKKDVYAVLGAWEMDGAGTPAYPPRKYLSTLTHEFNHSFVNPIVNKHWDELAKPASTIFPRVQGILATQAYEMPEIMLDEALVRAAAIKYQADHGVDSITLRKLEECELSCGFLNMSGLVAELQAYDRNRVTYPTFDSYVPEIVRFYQAIADGIKDVSLPWDNKRPSVKAIEPFGNGATKVDPKTKELRIVFDRPMYTERYRILIDDGLPVPDIESVSFTEDHRTLVFRIKNLEPEATYKIRLVNFLSNERYPIESYLLEFTTAALK